MVWPKSFIIGGSRISFLSTTRKSLKIIYCLITTDFKRRTSYFNKTTLPSLLYRLAVSVIRPTSHGKSLGNIISEEWSKIDPAILKNLSTIFKQLVEGLVIPNIRTHLLPIINFCFVSCIYPKCRIIMKQ
uniref:HMG box domain-containing protein n=1 Tax=Heterorhabditis bacteriophora TaxID=37862 RepID=A0A1I7WPZ3_HETBA